MNSGIYTITCLINSKFIVGYATNFNTRKAKHFNALRSNKHHNPHLQNAFNLYGEENFVFEILEEYPPIIPILASAEHWWCNMLNSHNREIGYNEKPTEHTQFTGISEETRKNMSKSAMGRKMTDTDKLKMREAKLGKKQSKEVVEKRIRAKSWYKHTEEHKRKISESNRGKSKKSSPWILIEQTDKDGNLIKVWNSMKELEENTKFRETSILRNIKNDTFYKGFKFKKVKKQ